MKKIAKAIYTAIPLKKELFILLKKIWKPPQSVYQHLHFKGIINVEVNKTSGFKLKHYGYVVENDIFWAGLLGEWEKYSISLWIKLVGVSNVIFDVGANTGVYSLISKALNKNADVHAFEPVKRIYSKLKYNNVINGFDITCVEKAVSNTNGYVDFFDVDERHLYSASLNKNFRPSEGQKAIKVETVTLDSYIAEKSIDQVDLVKIDVETFEPQVLEGFAIALKKFRPTMLVEVLSDEIGEKIMLSTKALGYLYFDIDEKKGPKKVDLISKGSGINFLICTDEVAKNLELI